MQDADLEAEDREMREMCVQTPDPPRPEFLHEVDGNPFKPRPPCQTRIFQQQPSVSKQLQA
eukprot:14924721-Alexandrium_andersonii.AAC.1